MVMHNSVWHGSIYQSKQHLCPISEMKEYPAQEDNLLLFSEVSVLGFAGGVENSAQLCSTDSVSSPNSEE